MNDALTELLETQHAEWLQNPVTQQALKRINEHKQSFVKILSNEAQNQNISDASYRFIGVNVRNVDAIITLLTNTALFLNKQQINTK